MPLPPVLYEDDALIAFDKPSDLLQAPDRREPSAENLQSLVQARWGSDLATVHRLDPDTSGLVLYAKTKVALDFLSGQFQSKTVTKIYCALTVGVPVTDEFVVDLVMKEDEGRPGRMCVVKKHGKTSLTSFQVLEKFPQSGGRPGFAQVECRPATGRPHQVRLHLAEAGTPVLNDALYGYATVQLLLSGLKRGYRASGDERPLITRLALHAGGLTFTHPLTREKFTLEAPRPKDFEVALKYLRKFGPGSVRR
jgi:RluA family pseudouridine synthase